MRVSKNKRQAGGSCNGEKIIAAVIVAVMAVVGVALTVLGKKKCSNMQDEGYCAEVAK